MRSKSTAPLLLSLLPLATASGFDCKHINADGVKYDLSPLGGVHSVYHADTTDQYVQNTTYVLNICNILKGAAIRGPLKCGTSKNICGFRYTSYLDSSHVDSDAFPIVGLDHLGHGSKDPEITRLKKLDSSREGLQVKLSGGEYKDADGKKKDAGAVIEFQCDRDRSGLEGLVTNLDEQQMKMKRERVRREGDNTATNGTTSEEDNGDPNRALQFKSFGQGDDNTYILKLDWKTRYACDDYERNKKNDSSHWGFFTWLIIIVFLCTAAYLIFGSWLNYNRYGARGWDLLPHGDTVRDIPYILSDWFRRVVNTVQGTGSRGGYSAV